MSNTIIEFVSGIRCKKCKTIEQTKKKKIIFFEEVKNNFKDNECELLTLKYDNCNQILEYKCKEGHLNKKSFLSFKYLVHKCVKCQEDNITDKNKGYTYDDVKKIFANENYTLLSTKYKNMSEKLEFKCDKGHIKQITLCKFLYRGTRCTTCSGGERATIESIKEEFKNSDCILISTIYDPKKNIEYTCKEGHKCLTTLRKWRLSQYKCNTCKHKNIKNKRKIKYSEIKEEFEKNKYILLLTEEEYNKLDIKSTTKIKFKCNNDHENETTYRYIKCDKLCSMCTGNKKLTIEEVRKKFEERGYTLLSDTYINARSPLEFICPNNHKNKIIYDIFSSRDGNCSLCNIKSYGEEKISKYLEKINYNFIREKKFDDCKNIKKLPFDFYVDNKFIIEYDGNMHFEAVEYFGGDKSLKINQFRDIIKTKYCKDNKIPLLRICYKDYKNMETIIDEFIKLINKPKNKILIKYSREDMYEYLKN